MTLSGVIKDILLVLASMLIFGDPVTPLQAFGYTIALCGLVWYKLGAEKIKEYIGKGQYAWADYGQRRPVLRRVTIIGLVFVTILLLFGVLSFSGAVPAAYDPAKVALGKFKEVGDKTGAGA